MAKIDQIIAAINPDKYLKVDNAKELLEFKELIKTEGISKAAEKAKPKAEAEHKLVYESYAESLEPIYYFVLDLMNDFKLAPEKLIDNFTATPGSTQFVELADRASRMQQQASSILGNVNTVLRSVLNIVYDLKDFRLRLKSYEELKSKDESMRKAARLSLKQIWMDKVDINKGNSSIKAMTLQGGFVTLIDAFLASETVKEAANLDLDDRIKRIVIPRIQEFNAWVEQSESELSKRYELEKTYLRSQVNSLKLYSRWAKPYLLTAQQLESGMSKNAALVKTFNRTILELTLLGKAPVNAEEVLPKQLKNQARRAYNSCILIDFTFTAVPIQGKFIGKAEVTFKGYALNDDEIKKFKQEFEKSDATDVLRLIEGVTDESLSQLQEEINFFLEEKEMEKKAKEEKASEESNPILALLGFYNKSPEKKKEEGKKEEISKVQPDNWFEKEHLRPAAAKFATDVTFNLFDIYKKAHGMPSYS